MCIICINCNLGVIWTHLKSCNVQETLISLCVVNKYLNTPNLGPMANDAKTLGCIGLHLLSKFKIIIQKSIKNICKIWSPWSKHNMLVENICIMCILLAKPQALTNYLWTTLVIATTTYAQYSVVLWFVDPMPITLQKQHFFSFFFPLF